MGKFFEAQGIPFGGEQEEGALEGPNEGGQKKKEGRWIRAFQSVISFSPFWVLPP